MNKLALIALCLGSLGGCETAERVVREHPKATAVIGSIAITSILLSTHRGHAGRNPHDVEVSDPRCYGQPRMCE